MIYQNEDGMMLKHDLENNYFRLVFLPHVDELVPALEKLKNFFSTYKQVNHKS